MASARTFITVIEVDPFAATARRAGLSEDERQELTIFIARSPEAGVLIPGTGGLRKLRWAGKGKGRSGGFRVIYYFFNTVVPIYLLAVYAKNERTDLTPREKTRLSDLAKELKQATAARSKRRTR